MRRNPKSPGLSVAIRLLGWPSYTYARPIILPFCDMACPKLGSGPRCRLAVAVVCRWFFVDTSSPPVTIAFELDLQTPSFVCSVEVSWVENGPDSLAEI